MKKIQSTALIDQNAFICILDLCRKQQITSAKLLEGIISEMIKSRFSVNQLETFSTVKYQNRGGEYSLVHYSIDPKLYESLLDIRKLAKLSISRMLSDFINNYLHNKKDIKPFFFFFFENSDRNQAYYSIMSHFNKKNHIFSITIRAKLE